MCPNFFSFLNRVLLILIILTTLLLMFLWTTIKVVYYTRKENRERKERQKMHPDMETVRRDSKLAAIIEEYHLKTMHRLILKLLQPLSRGNLLKMVKRTVWPSNVVPAKIIRRPPGDPPETLRGGFPVKSAK